MNTDHEKYMREALKEARRAWDEGEIPIGAVVVCEGRITHRSGSGVRGTHHRPGAQPDRDPSRPHRPCGDAGHDGRHRLHWREIPARMHSVRHSRALSDVRRRHGLDTGRGSGLRCQVGAVVYGADDPKRGYTLFSPSLLHPRTKVCSGILADECGAVMTDFFKKIRK